MMMMMMMMILCGWKKVVMSMGQQGGPRGEEWSDGVFSSIKQLKIAYDHNRIHSITTQYCDHNGNSTWSDRHGGNSHDGTIEKVVLDYPNEYLVSIHGCLSHDNDDGKSIIGSLTLESNKKSYGPYGDDAGPRFWFPTTTATKIVGFHGRSDSCLISIGIKVVPIHNTTIVSSLE